MSDNHKRTIAKAITYRILGILWLLIISLLITGSIKETITINGIYHILRIVDFFVHERLWIRISWGKNN